MKCEVEYTDTFGGQANYSWVKRETFECADNENPMKKAKALIGLTGVRGVKIDMGETISFKPYNSNTIMFITFGE